MNRIVIDAAAIGSKEEFFAVLRSQLGEDLLCGSNLDALHDVLTSLTAHTVIEIRGESRLAEVLGDYWKRLLWMINDCLDENRNLELEYAE